MTVYGKLLGAIIGGMVGLATEGWLGAVLLASIGAAIGHGWDSLYAPPDIAPAPASSRPATPRVPAPPLAPEPDTDPGLPAALSEARAHFARHVCALFVEVARVDGDVSRDEVRVVRNFFEADLRFSPPELELVRIALKEALAHPPDLATSLAGCRAELTISETLLLLDALYELALIDGRLQRGEGEAIRLIAEGLAIPDSERRAIAAIHLGDALPAYDVLGVTPETGDDELRRAYRRLAAAHHPDRVAHLGAGAVEVATRRFKEIQEAWDQVRKVRAL